MNSVVNSDNCQTKLVGKELGSVKVYMYKDASTGLPFFYVQAENEEVLQLRYVIEDTLYHF